MCDTWSNSPGQQTWCEMSLLFLFLCFLAILYICWSGFLSLCKRIKRRRPVFVGEVVFHKTKENMLIVQRHLQSGKILCQDYIEDRHPCYEEDDLVKTGIAWDKQTENSSY